MVADITSEIVLKRIREERKRQRISLQTLAKKLGVTGQYVSMMERGITSLKMEDYLKICQALNVNPIKILICDENKKKAETLAEKIYSLSERDFDILVNIIELMQ